MTECFREPTRSNVCKFESTADGLRVTHGIILGSVLDRVVRSLIISLAIAGNVYGVGVTIVIFSVIQYKHDSLI